ncbi:U32 family peptidase [Oscillochloris sp. ZM17-4]|uniref:U32 family peptidase n=1 Tax=Oscillochloris sp. ZM17-4 TaxID=2866714 RepID=UPI001C730637|nr:U32 family peptidase [Oscillochloris sp. ZM17-4]MBX0328219.1 U32 family peptidase [Oscillochloris sp. ZM17-4]
MSDTHKPIKPEVMSPAGHWPQLQAAIEAGADAVYFGLNHFSARAKVGFTLEELPDALRTLHRRGVKGYVTFNTLVFDHELREAARALEQIAAAGADSIIVQDVGVARMAHQIAPGLAIHGSTQMSITSAEGVELARQFGVSRVVLARELSLADVRAIRAATDLELEMFGHGALCVSYSGQCFSSEAWGGRSANRGQCAQACRLPYELIVDGRHVPLGDARYLLSPGDLYALQHIPEIVQIGVSAIKIEGRYKGEEYVALTTSAYRRAIDEAWAGLPLSITRADEIHLEQVYSRGLGDYFISGTDHQKVVRGRSPRHRGVLAGRVDRVFADYVLVEPNPEIAAAPLKAGDGVVFDAADWRSPQEREEGGRLYIATPTRDGLLELEFAYGALDFSRIRPGDLLWRTHDPDLDRAARPYIAPAAPLRRQPLTARVVAHEGAPLELTFALVSRPELSASVRSAEPLGHAQRRAVDEAYLREQLGRLGGTPYELAGLELDIQGEPFAPSSLLNSLRREAAEALGRRQEAGGRRQEAGGRRQEAGGRRQEAGGSERSERPASCLLHLLVRTPEQLDAALELRPASITLDYLELYGLRPAVERVQAAGIEARVASPRVLKPSEQRVVYFLLKLGCPILVRSGGLLQALQVEDRPALIGDFSLNTANQLTAEIFMGLGLERLTPTYDLNAAQVADLAREVGPAAIEAVAYQHLPVFHTEHCVFCRFLSSGTSYKDCGHPCETQRVELRDERGRAHPVMADVGCRNTVFGAEAQEASRHMDLWREAGVAHYRLEFVHETGAQVAQVGRAFAEYLAGTTSAAELSRQLAQVSPQGTTEGSLFVPEGYELIPLM